MSGADSHAPRERVSWNLVLPLIRGSLIRHAPRERVSWNIDARPLRCCSNRHAPRERVSWNLYNPQVLMQQSVTLHVSVWVEISIGCNVVTLCYRHAPRERVSWNQYYIMILAVWNVTLHVSVWVEIAVPWLLPPPATSRSTWACELKLVNNGKLQLNNPVTLHVSVWVEIW